MPFLPTAPLLLLLFLGGASSPLPEDMGVRRLELHAQAPAKAPRVRVSPGRTTVLTFDTPVQHVEVEAPERWGPKLSSDNRTLNLKPTSAVQPGEEVRLTVRFEDGAAPEQVQFLLGVHPGGPEEVEVSRHPRTLESFRQEAGEQRALVEQCQGELARVQAERGGPGGLTQVVDTGLVGEENLTFEDIRLFLSERPDNALELAAAHAWRTQGRLLLKLRLRNLGAAEWTAAGASLTGKGGGTLKMLSVWQHAPIALGAPKPPVVYVEVELSAQVQGPYTLRLWAEGGTRLVTLDGVPL